MSQLDQALRINYDIGGNYSKGFSAVQMQSNKTFKMLNKNVDSFNDMTGVMSTSFDALGSSIGLADDYMEHYGHTTNYLSDEFKDTIKDVLLLGSLVDKDLGRALKVLNKTSVNSAIAFIGIKKALDKTKIPAEKYIKQFEKLIKNFNIFKKVYKLVTGGFKSIQQVMEKQTLKTVEKITSKWKTFLESMTSGGAIQEVLKIDDAVAGIGKKVALTSGQENKLKDIAGKVALAVRGDQEAILENLGAIYKSGITSAASLQNIATLTEKIGIAADGVDTKELSMFFAQLQTTGKFNDKQIEQVATGFYNLAGSSSEAYTSLTGMLPVIEKVLTKIPDANKVDFIGKIGAISAMASNAFTDASPLIEFFAKMTEVSSDGIQAMSRFGSVLGQIGKEAGPEILDSLNQLKAGNFDVGFEKLTQGLEPLLPMLNQVGNQGDYARKTFFRISEAMGMSETELVKLTQQVATNQGAFGDLMQKYKEGSKTSSMLDAGFARQNMTYKSMSNAIENAGKVLTEQFYRPMINLRDYVLVPVQNLILKFLDALNEMPKPLKDITFALSVLMGLGLGTFLTGILIKTVGVTAAIGAFNLASKLMPGIMAGAISALGSMGVKLVDVNGAMTLSRGAIAEWWKTIGRVKGAEAVVKGYNAVTTSIAKAATAGVGVMPVGKKATSWIVNWAASVHDAADQTKNPVASVVSKWLTNVDTAVPPGKFKAVGEFFEKGLIGPIKSVGKSILDTNINFTKGLLGIGKGSSDVVAGLSDVGLWVNSLVKNIPGLTPLLAGIGSLFTGMGTAIWGAVSGLGSFAVGIIAALGPVGIAIGVIGALWLAIEYGPESVGKAILGATQWLEGFVALLPGYLDSAIKFIPNMITDAFNFVVQLVQDLPSMLTGGVQKAGESMGSKFLKSVMNIMWDLNVLVLRLFIALPEIIVRTFIAAFKGIFNLAVQAAATTWDLIISGASWLADSIVSFFTADFWMSKLDSGAVESGVQSIFNNISDWVSEKFYAMWDYVYEGFLTMLAKLALPFVKMINDLSRYWDSVFADNATFKKNEKERQANLSAIKAQASASDKSLKNKKKETTEVRTQEALKEGTLDKQERQARALARFNSAGNLKLDMQQFAMARRNAMDATPSATQTNATSNPIPDKVVHAVMTSKNTGAMSNKEIAQLMVARAENVNNLANSQNTETTLSEAKLMNHNNWSLEIAQRQLKVLQKISETLDDKDLAKKTVVNKTTVVAGEGGSRINRDYAAKLAKEMGLKVQ